MPKSLALAWLMLCAAASPVAQGDHAGYLGEFLTAERAHRPFRPITSFNPAVSLDQAYAVQHALVERKRGRGDRIAGYRGGLMSETSLRQRAVREPLVGVQFGSGQRRSPATVHLAGYRHPAIEVKIGFVFAHDLPDGEISPGQLRQAVATVVPVIDVPDIGYADPLHYSAVDMVAADISAADYVVGSGAHDCADLDRETMTLTRDGKVVTQGRGSDSLGNIWQSLGTVVDLARRHGYRIRRGQLVLTGKLGGKVDVGAGRYVATFSCLGGVSAALVP